MDAAFDSKMIGRDTQLDRLRRFLRSGGGAGVRVALISGPPGVGKSTIARRALKALKDGEWTVSAKFEQYLTPTPSGFFITAMNELAARIGSLPEADRARIRSALVDAVSPNGQLVINLCPRMGDVLGAQPELIELPPQESQVRLSIMMRKLIGAVTASGRRLTMLLDDLQWADPATLRLLCDLVSDPEVRDLAVVATYRASETAEAPPGQVGALRRAVTASGGAPFALTLEGLSRKDIAAYFREALDLPARIAARLAAQIERSTGGAPLAVVNSLDVLMQKGLLTRDAAGGWTLRVDDAEELLDDAGVLDLVGIRLSALAPEARRTLGIAAALGGRFDAAVLAEAADLTPAETRTHIDAFREHQLVVAAPDGAAAEARPADLAEYGFAHDYIQQVAYDRIARADIRQGRLRAARAYARRFARDGANDWLFRSVALFGEVLPDIRDADEARQVFELNTRAARRALDSGGPSMALSCAQAAAKVLPESAWRDAYETTRDLHLAGAEAAYLTGSREALEAFSAAAADNARDALDWARAREVLLQERVSAMAYSEALDVAIETLARLDAPLPRRAGKARVAVAFGRMMLRLRGVSLDELADLPRMSDPRAECEMRTLMLASSTAYFAEPNLFALMVLRMVELSAEHGNSPLSAFGWMCYGLAQCSLLGRVEQGYGYGILALKLVERHRADHLRARVHMLFNVFVRHWREPRDAISDHLREGEAAGLRTGDLEFASYCMWHRCSDHFWAGRPLPAVRAMAQEALDASRRANQTKAAFLLGMAIEFIDWAMADPAAAVVPDDAAHEDYCLSRRDYTSLCYVKLMQALRHALTGDFAACLAATREIDRHFESLQGQFYVPHHLMLRTLAASELARDAGRGRGGALSRLARAGAARLDRWARGGSRDCAPLAEFAQACARFDPARPAAALALFDALTRRADPGAPLGAALAARTFARAQSRVGLETGAARALEDAAAMAKLWGGPGAATRMRGGAAAPATQTPDAARAEPSADGPPRVSTAEELAADAAGRIFDLVGGGRIELVLLENDQAIAIMQAIRDGEGPAHVDLMERNADIGVSELVRATVAAADADDAAAKAGGRDRAAPGEPAAASRLLCVPLPQHDETAACLLAEPSAFGSVGVPHAQLRALAGPVVAVLRQERLKRSLRREEARRVALSTVHARIIPQYFLRALGHQDITDLRVGDFAHKRMSVMFCDMRGSTGIVEKIGARTSMELFNELFTAIESEVLRGGGYVDNFLGDAVLCLFETPADVVVSSAADVSHELHRLHDSLAARGLPAPRFGIGMSTGDVVLGAVGGLNQIRGGSIGDTMNLAARVESLTRRYGASLLLSESTHDELNGARADTIRQIDFVTVLGRNHPIRLYEVVDALPAERAEKRLASIGTFREGVSLFYARDFRGAAAAFADCVAADPDDVPAQLYLEQARDCLRTGVPDDWTGMRRLTSK